jgi:pimeloyl-ACP methyl ester carboxylesterase
MRTSLTIIAGVAGLGLIALGFWLYTPDRSRAALEARYLGGPIAYREVAGTRLRVADSGPRDAPAVILLHGFGSSLETWDGWAGPLSATYRVIRFDLPGFGLSGADPTGDYSDARSIAIIAALMDRLGLARASLIGNSLGGRIAWRFAAAWPDRVDKLVLVSPDGFASPGFEYGKPPDVPLMMQALPYTMPDFMFRPSLAAAYADPRALSDATYRRYRDLMLAPGVRRAILDRMADTVLEDPVPLLRRIQAPTLLLWGEQDAMIPFGNAADYRRDIPNATLVPLPGLGHVPFEEAPAASLPPVLRFLGGPA